MAAAGSFSERPLYAPSQCGSCIIRFPFKGLVVAEASCIIPHRAHSAPTRRSVLRHRRGASRIGGVTAFRDAVSCLPIAAADFGFCGGLEEKGTTLLSGAGGQEAAWLVLCFGGNPCGSQRHVHSSSRTCRLHNFYCRASAGRGYTAGGRRYAHVFGRVGRQVHGHCLPAKSLRPRWRKARCR